MSIYPTLMELCGLARPQHVEGANIKPLLLNPNAGWEQPALTTHGFNNHAARSARWRYIRYNGGGEELYDEIKDPYEWTNLAGEKKHGGVKADLSKIFPKTNKPRGAQARGSEDGAEQYTPKPPQD
jgi:arylsulfatase A-like enzyme